jgi:hypothetical protein
LTGAAESRSLAESDERTQPDGGKRVAQLNDYRVHIAWSNSVMNLGTQIITIAAVIAGALTSYLVTTLGDRSRYRREVAREWVDRKLESYTRYATDIKSLVIVTRQITALHGLHDAAPGIAEEKAMTLLDEAEVRRSTSYEAVKLLGDAETLRATRALNDAAHTLEWIARGQLSSDSGGWDRSWHFYLDASDRFRQCVRRELNVPGDFLSNAGWARPSLSADDAGTSA